MNLNQFFTRRLVFALITASMLTKVDSKQGWKTSGNSYLVYNTSTSFKFTKKLMINGTFAANKENTANHTIVSIKDSNDVDVFTYTVSNDFLMLMVYESNVSIRTTYQHMTELTTGEVIQFALILSEKTKGGGKYEYQLETFSSHDWPGKIPWDHDGTTWNLDEITVFVGGSKSGIMPNFHGCLSHFVLEKVDIIDTYFDQYPKNMNPKLVGNFNKEPEKCNNQNRKPIKTRDDKGSDSDENEQSSTNQQSTNQRTSPTINSSSKPKPARKLAQLIISFLILRSNM